MEKRKSKIEPTAGDLVSFDVWLGSLDRTRATGHRWRKQFPWLTVLNIFGKLYVTRDSIAEFERRALAGEFQRDIRPKLNPVIAFLPRQGRARKNPRKACP
jgi:hypothetical protein